MPEGHVLHRLARDQSKGLVDVPLSVHSPQGRFAKEAAELDGRSVRQIEAVGKHLLYRFEEGITWHVHLGLYGKFRPFKGPEPEPRGQVRAAVAGPAGGFHLVGPNQCELLGEPAVEALFARLGPDPLRADADTERFVKRVCGSRAAVGTLLLDQSVIAGVGNIFRADGLFLEGIHPQTRGVDLTEAQVRAVWDRMAHLLKVGKRVGKIVTADPDVVGKPPSRMNRDERLLIYKAERCPVCGSRTEQLALAARRIDCCPTCQPL